MVPPMARSTRVDGRGRRVNSCGGRSPQTGTYRQCLQNCPKTGSSKSKNNPWVQKPPVGNQLKGKREQKRYISCKATHWTLHTICLLVMILLWVPCCVTETTHELYKWTLLRREDQKVIQEQTTPGKPSFKAHLSSLITIDKRQAELKAFYMCPASNPGKEFCNYPGHYYCAYWGCETVASDWIVNNQDKYLQVGWGPSGCRKPKHGYDGTVLGSSNCYYIYINITKPEDPGWLTGKTWGIRFWEPGTDRGGSILIRKKIVPHDPELVGPNTALAAEDITSTNLTEASENQTEIDGN